MGGRNIINKNGVKLNMIRNAQTKDLPEILRIYDSAREFMRTHNNPTQWAGNYPDYETIVDDIEKQQIYVVTNDDDKEKICGCFALIGGVDETYIKIYEGEWKNDSQYGAIHRVASDGTKKGIFAECVEFARKSYNHLRVDTHKDNIPMQGAITKCGFEYCGIIYLQNGDPRLAYEWYEK